MEAPPGYHLSGSYCHDGSPHFAVEKQGGDHCFVEDLLDFSNESDYCFGGGGDAGVDGATAVNHIGGSVVTAAAPAGGSISSCHYGMDLGCLSFADTGFSDGLCAPYDELAELEWLSNFVEEPFSCEDMQKLQLISGVKPTSSSSSSSSASDTGRSGVSVAQGRCGQAATTLRPENHVPGKIRSKRSRPALAPTSWSSRLLVLPQSASAVASAATNPRPGSTTKKNSPKPGKREDTVGRPAPGADGRKCLHCAAERTPQWRAGPMGPKTLCNACGVRYKSGRLVPEYRPAASPTFVVAEHSNSHRRVLELRRQKETMQLPNGTGDFMQSTGNIPEALAGTVGDQFVLRHNLSQLA